jgi:hypothetical protein
MSQDSSELPAFEPSAACWRKSTFSGSGDCVVVAPIPGDRIAVRDSKHPEGGTLLLTRPEMAAWLAGIKAGEFDDLVGTEVGTDDPN